MKATELRTKDVAGLQQELSDLGRAHFALRMQIATQQNSNTAQLKRLRRDIAPCRPSSKRSRWQPNE